ncbi:MAG: TonB family protein [Porticoccaceae bacterium]|nr:TonB family protein [Porticoccaceae bacterium]
MIDARSGYFIAAIASVGLHAVVIAAVLANWQPETKKTIVQPQYIQAELMELAPKKKSVKKPKITPSVDKVAQQREIDKRRAKEKKLAQQTLESERKAQLLKDQQKAEKARKDREEKQRKADEERVRKQAEKAEQQRKEQALILAKEDKQAANSYLQLIQAQISQQWNRPKSARRNMETLIELRLVPTGRIVGVEILESSGDPAFDLSVEQAVRKAEPFSELQRMESRIFEQYFRSVKIVFNPEDLRL